MIPFVLRYFLTGLLAVILSIIFGMVYSSTMIFKCVRHNVTDEDTAWIMDPFVQPGKMVASGFRKDRKTALGMIMTMIKNLLLWPVAITLNVVRSVFPAISEINRRYQAIIHKNDLYE